MIYDAGKKLLLLLLRAPAGPPEPPAGSPESVLTFRASKRFLYYRLVGIGLVFLIFLGIAFSIALAVTLDSKASSDALFFWLLPAGAMLFGMVAYFLTRLEYDMRYYIITDRSLRIREGVWTITEVTLTYANVQHLEIHQGPIQQILGIADVIVHTAGGVANSQPAAQPGLLLLVSSLSGLEQPGRPRGHRGVLSGIDNAEEVREQINSLLKSYRDAGLGDPEERARPGQQSAAWSVQELHRLREIRDELRGLRAQTLVKTVPPPSA